MNNDINLISNQDAASLKEKKRLKAVRTIAIASLAIVGLVSVVIFIINSQTSLVSIKKDENSALQNISYLNKKAAKLAIINNRLKDISDILQKRKNYTSAMNTLLQLMPPGVNIGTLDLGKKDVTLIVNSNSLLPVDKFLNSLIDLSSKKQVINGITIESLIFNEKTGNYSLSIKTTLQ
jgi:Tfp pilus assembly protein PilN